MSKIKIAFIGTGGFGASNLSQVLESGRDDYEIVATCDPYPEVSVHYNTLQTKQIPNFMTIEELYQNHQPDLVIISTPIQFHAKQVCYCLEHDSNVLCEKPLTGDAHDLELLQKADKESGCFAAVGFQWSFTDSIQKLKADIMEGKYGKPLFMKCMVLWPREKSYFLRSTGWAGKIYAKTGEKILDSIANNATAHYIHNILYVLGSAVNESDHAIDITADLLRTNNVETFDTAVIKFKLGSGASGLFVASHATGQTLEPCFEYTFEKGTVSFSKETNGIIGMMSDGSKIEYGDPGQESNKKIEKCMDWTKAHAKEEIECGIAAASGHVRFIEMLHERNSIHNTNAGLTVDAGNLLYVDGLHELLVHCYNNESLIRDSEDYHRIVAP